MTHVECLVLSWAHGACPTCVSCPLLLAWALLMKGAGESQTIFEGKEEPAPPEMSLGHLIHFLLLTCLSLSQRGSWTARLSIVGQCLGF